MNSSNERFVAMETKIAYQEKTMDGLNAVVLTQQKEIDGLALKVDALVGKFRELGEDEFVNDAQIQKPPHY